jgi:heme exporter protein D
MSLTEHLQMGVYGAYVWPAYGFTAIAILWMIVGARRAHRAGLEAARRRIEMEKSHQ